METLSDTAAARGSALAELIARHVAEAEPLSRRHNEQAWLANVTGRKEHEEESARLDAALRRLHARTEPYAFLRALHAAGGVEDERLQRQSVLLLHAYQAQQIAPDRIERMVRLEKSLESRFNNFRADLDGERVGDNALKRVLRESGDVAARRRAWEASKQVGAEVEADLLALVRERNEAARAMGEDDYYSMMLALDELDEAGLFALLDEVDRGTRPLFEAYRAGLDGELGRRFGVASRDLRPWHFSDPFFQEAPAAGLDPSRWFAQASLEELAARFFETIGLPVREVLARSDLYEKAGKCPHAFCLSVDRGDDVRVLCNLQPDEYWMSTLLHELGHAVYDIGVDRALPWVLRGPAHTLTTEASAMLFGRLTRNPAWLARWAGMPAGRGARRGGRLRPRDARSAAGADALGTGDVPHGAGALQGPVAGPALAVVGTGGALPVGEAPGGARRPGLGEQDPLQHRAGVLPELPARRDDGFPVAATPAERGAGRGRGRVGAIGREPGGGRLPARAAVRAGTHAGLARHGGARHRAGARSGSVRGRTGGAIGLSRYLTLFSRASR